MKTIREWLEELPEPYRSEALENCKKDLVLNSMEPAKRDAISVSFTWELSPQGHDYWFNLWKTL